MASPQLENGYTPFANELLEALMRHPPASVAARQIWDWVFRNSWGRKKAMNTRPTSVRALADALEMSKTKAAKALAALLDARRLVRNPDASLSIQKDYDLWLDAAPARAFRRLRCPEYGDKLSP